MLSRKMMAGLAAALLIAWLPVFPVSFASQYHGWYYDLGINAYTYTALSHFGVTLALALLLKALFDFLPGRSMPRCVLVSGAACVFAMLGFCGARLNDAMVRDIKTEVTRWRAVDEAVQLTALPGMQVAGLYAPRLQSGTWYTVVPADYWPRYAKAKHNAALAFPRVFPAVTGPGQIGVMDYAASDGAEPLSVTVAALTKDAAGAVVAEKIAVALDKPDASDVERYILSYTDRERGTVTVRFSQLPVAAGQAAARMIDGLDAVPESIRFEPHSSLPPLPAPCGDRIEGGTVVEFTSATSGLAGHCNGIGWLDGNWHPAEPAGSWAAKAAAAITVPTAGLPPCALRVTVNIASYVGLGFTDGAQKVSLTIKDQVLGSRTDKRSDGPGDIVAVVPAAAWQPGTPLILTVQTEPMINPAAAGGNPDKRDLGAHLRWLKVEPVR